MRSNGSDDPDKFQPNPQPLSSHSFSDLMNNVKHSNLMNNNHRNQIDLNELVNNVLMDVDEPLKETRRVMKEVADYQQRIQPPSLSLRDSVSRYACIPRTWLYEVRFAVDSGNNQRVRELVKQIDSSEYVQGVT